MTRPVLRLVNAAERSLASMFPRFFTEKHDFQKDFGFPETVTFDLAYRMYCRHGLARAAVDKTVAKTWQDAPLLQEYQRDGSEGSGRRKKAETRRERDIRQKFDDLRLWQHLAEADRRGLVGAYSGVILRLADGKRFSEPVDAVPGLDGLVEVIPAWQGQLEVSQWDLDETSPNYGQPKMFRFNEAAIDNAKKQPRNFELHPDRVIIWSKDGTLNGGSALEPGYDDLVTIAKIIGAGGEGFWKNAKSSPVLEIDKEASVTAMAQAMGIKPDELVDKMNEQVEAFQRGFDQLLMLQGMQAKTLGVTLPSPEHFFAVAVQSFAASFRMPMKILVGMQTGERASSEDADEWAQTNMGRRTGEAIPNIMGLVRRFERFNILPERDWHIEWSDLTGASAAEKFDRVGKMADANQKMQPGGELVFTPEEMRSVVDMEPLSEAEKYVDDPSEDDAAALPPDQQAA